MHILMLALLQNDVMPNLEFEAPLMIAQPESFGSMLIRTFFVLLLIAGMVYAFMFLLKKYAKGRFMLKGSPNDTLEVIERIPLSAKQEICILRVKNSILLLGITENSMTVLKEIEKKELFAKDLP